MGAEQERVADFGKLENGLRQAGDWYRWGPYVSERQWGTVREVNPPVQAWAALEVFAVEVSDLDAAVERLRQAGAHFRNDVVTGVGGRQVLVEDPSGNPVELFEPTRPEARLGRT